jgi:hypothetical protein
MRAICGAIIVAGALIGLGLTALGIGTRYHYFSQHDEKGEILFLRFGQLDSAFILMLVVLLLSLLIGLGIAFLGLAFHHERRHRERLREIAVVTPRTEHPAPAGPRPPA